MEENNPKKYNFFLQGGNQAVLLIHGITGTPSEMRYLGKSLNKAGFTVYCNTLPRHCDTLSELKKVTWQEIEDSCIKDFQYILNGHRRVFVAGLSMGALMAIHLARKFPDKVAGIIALAPTIFYDGWALGKGKALMEVVWHIPWVRNMINIREDWPFGLKDVDLRENIERFYKNARAEIFSKKVFLFGSPFFPMANLYQHRQFTRVVIKEMAQVFTPILIIHARDDDMASLKNAQYLLGHIGSSSKKLVVLVNSYHMITIDNDKDKVVGEIVAFINNL